MKSAFLRSLAAALAISTAFTPTFAANNYAVKDANGTTISKCSVQQGDSSQADCAVQTGTWNVGLTGTLPAYAATPTFNIGTAPTFSVTGTFWQATQPVSGTFWQATQPISHASLGAPTDASNCAFDTTSVSEIASLKCSVTKLTAAVASLASIDGKVGAEGQLGFVSVPVVIGSDTLALTSATTSWTAGQLIGSTTSGGTTKVMQIQVCRTNTGHAQLRRLRLKTSAADAGFAGQLIIVSVYKNAPTPANGDRASTSGAISSEAAWINDYPVTLSKHFTDAEKGASLPLESNIDCASGQNYVYALLSAGTTFAPTAGSLTLTLLAESEGR